MPDLSLNELIKAKSTANGNYIKYESKRDKDKNYHLKNILRYD